MSLYGIYPSLESVLEELQMEKYKADDNVLKLLKIYFEARENAKKVVKNHPLIVLEGLDLSGKSTLSKLLARKIKAVLLRTPPRSILPLRFLFDNRADLRTAFYTLGNYIAAFEMLVALETKPVVVDRFWHSTCANALARACQGSPNECALPPKGHSVYRWPEDLLRPDIVLFLFVSEQERLKRQARRSTITSEEILLKENDTFRQNVILAYKAMEEPAVIEVDSDKTVKKTLCSLQQAIHHLV